MRVTFEGRDGLRSHVSKDLLKTTSSSARASRRRPAAGPRVFVAPCGGMWWRQAGDGGGGWDQAVASCETGLFPLLVTEGGGGGKGRHLGLWPPCSGPCRPHRVAMTPPVVAVEPREREVEHESPPSVRTGFETTRAPGHPPTRQTAPWRRRCPKTVTTPELFARRWAPLHVVALGCLLRIHMWTRYRRFRGSSLSAAPHEILSSERGQTFFWFRH